VAQNVAFGSRCAKLARADIERRVEEVLALVRLKGYGGRLPRRFGRPAAAGALARALAIPPTCCCVDSRSGHSTPSCAREVRSRSASWQRQLGLTTVMVTPRPGGGAHHGRPAGVMNEAWCDRSAASATSTKGRPTARGGLRRPQHFLAGAVEARGAVPPATAGCRSLPRRQGRPAVLSLRPERIESARAPFGPRLRTRQQPARYGGIRVLSRRPDRHPCAPVANDRLVVQIANREGGFAPEVGQPVHVGCRLAGLGLQRVNHKNPGGTMSKSFMINRRTALGGAAAFGGLAPVFQLCAGQQAIVVAPGAATIRGCSPRTSRPGCSPQGLDVVKDEGQRPARAPRCGREGIAARTSDIQGLSANDMYEPRAGPGRAARLFQDAHAANLSRR